MKLGHCAENSGGGRPQDPAAKPAQGVPVEVLPPEDRQTSSQSKESRQRAGNPDVDDRHRFLSTTGRFAISLALAGMADAAQAVFPPDWVFVDVAMSVAFLLIWGFRWEIAWVLIPELVPGMSVFPTWSLLAVYLGKKHGENPPNQTRSGPR